MNIKAFLDSYDLIRIEVKEYFNSDIKPCFYIMDNNHKLKSLRILNKVYMDDIAVYEVLAISNIIIGKQYTIYNNQGHHCTLYFRHVVRTPLFENSFYYDQNDLGATYFKDHTTFKVWAPTANNVYLNTLDDDGLHLMKRNEKGVFTLTIDGDHKGLAYKYHALINGGYVDSIDPYAQCSLPNQKGSVVVDIQALKTPKASIKAQDAIIYETSVRDFTSKLGKCHKGTFEAFVQSDLKTYSSKVAGFDYLKKLGITHVQLMPIYDFYTVNDYEPFKFYNWGYDPLQYNALKPAFGSDIKTPLKVIEEFKHLVKTIHENNMLVTMDVVYNHMYDRGMSSFEKLVPFYYFRLNQDGVYSNGSYCGNDFESTCKMGRKFIIDSVMHWAETFDLDGFRFDLMGIIDVETMRQIEQKLHALNPNILIYGEGWNMPTFLNDNDKSIMFQAYQLPQVAFFNDAYRDIIKGKSGEYDVQNCGYASGNSNLAYELRTVILGNTLNHNFIAPLQSINYCECHDNATVMDKLKMCLPNEDYYTWKKRSCFMIGLVLTSFGIPFIHSGQEFGREKQLLHNTYNISDEINGVDWELKDQNIDMVIYTQKMIALRKQINCLHLTTFEEIKERVNLAVLKDNMLKMTLQENGEIYKIVEIYYNPTQTSYDLSIDGAYDILYSEGNGIQIQPISIMIVGYRNS